MKLPATLAPMTLGMAAAIMSVGLAGCGPGAPAAPATPAADANAVTSTLVTSPEITAADLGARIKELADDKYEGRGPGDAEGEKSADWIAAEMKRIGLAPGNPDGTYFQIVKMVAQTVDPATSSLKIAGPGDKAWDLKLGPDAVFITKDQKNKTVSFADSDLVFVGYGVVAPEANWNDYAGVDMKGKTAVMFVNDPGFVTNDASLFNGKAMTYYGRWTYKFEEAARQGATAALIIHEDKPAAYGWGVVDLPAALAAFPEPGPVAISLTGDQVVLSWPDSGYASYRIYRADHAWGPFTFLGETTQSSWSGPRELTQGSAFFRVQGQVSLP